MFEGFSAEVRTDETTIVVRSAGAGPPVLLLHGFPETHLMRRDVAPLLARSFTVVCGGPIGLWRAWCHDVRGQAIQGGHFFPEEMPGGTARLLADFLAEPNG
jgi:pimeloyl-ACP methyl ester carboxylesterase